MPRCDHCGNEYDKSFTVTIGDSTHTFDSFECAIHVLAPVCSHCSCRIIGHGVEASSVHCAEKAGVSGLRDRQDKPGR